MAVATEEAPDGMASGFPGHLWVFVDYMRLSNGKDSPSPSVQTALVVNGVLKVSTNCRRVAVGVQNCGCPLVRPVAPSLDPPPVV